MTTARDFFDRVREASQDAERCHRQLKAMEQRMKSFGAQGYEPRVRSSSDPDKLGRRVASYVDRERSLETRMDEDYRIIDLGSTVIYGDGEREGLDKEQSPVWADILWWRYLADATWMRVARAVGYSVRPCQIMHNTAMQWLDESGFMADVMDKIDL